MFTEEARVAAKLNHPNIVQTIEVDSIDGRPFIAMEYLEGQPLRRVLKRFRIRQIRGDAVFVLALRRHVGIAP